MAPMPHHWKQMWSIKVLLKVSGGLWRHTTECWMSAYILAPVEYLSEESSVVSLLRQEKSFSFQFEFRFSLLFNRTKCLHGMTTFLNLYCLPLLSHGATWSWAQELILILFFFFTCSAIHYHKKKYLTSKIYFYLFWPGFDLEISIL